MTVPQGPSEIQHLLPALRDGSTDAYRELVRSMGEPLTRYALQIVGDPGTAQDVVQEALLRIYKRRKKLDASLELKGLCFRAVRNLARNHVRDAALRKQREQEADDMRGGNGDSGQASLAREAWELVKNLPATLREVVELRFSFGLSRAEIAATLEVPEGTVATRQRTALEQLREKMQTRTTAPAVLALPGLAKLLDSPQPSTPISELLNMEELVMNGIRNMRVKAAGMVASAAMVALLLLIGTGVTVNALVSDSPVQQNQMAQTNSASAYSSHARPDGTEASSTSANTEDNTPPQPGVKREVQPDVQPETPKQSSTKPEQEPAPGPQPETPVQPGPQTAPEQPEPETVKSAPVFKSTPGFSAVVGLEYLYRIEVTGAPAPTIHAGALPMWLKLEDNLLRGTPDADSAGRTVAIELVARNGVSPEARQAFQLVVGAAPEITGTPGVEAVADEAYNYAATVKAKPQATLRLENAPAWLTLKGDVVSGTPSRGDVGIAKDIKLVADNGVKPDAEQVWTITVNSAPRFDSQPVVTVKAGTTYEYAVQVSGSPDPKVGASRLPKWLVFENGKLTGKPRNEDIGKSKKITLTADNGIGKKVEQEFRIEVTENPEYVEMPWTLEELRAYYKVGLKWSGTDYYEVSAVMGKIYYDKESHEVISVKDDIVTVKFIVSTPSVAPPGRVVWDDIESEYTLSLTDLANGKHPRALVGKVTYKGTEKRKFGGKTYKVHVYEFAWTDEQRKADTSGYRWVVQRLYFIDGKPGVIAMEELIDPKLNVTEKCFELDEISD